MLAKELQKRENKREVRPAYRRILLKLSGEALNEGNQFELDQASCQEIAKLISEIHQMGVQVGVVVGGGNIFRGAQAAAFGFARPPADHIGMLATIINGLILQQCLATLGCETKVMSALNTDFIVERYSWPKAMDYLSRNQVVIFVGGTGNPYFTTDTAAALRASEIEAEVLIKATKVDGIYEKDPKHYPKAEKFDRLTYAQVFAKKIQVMDLAAIALCEENEIPIHVCNFFKKGALMQAICEKTGGTLVYSSNL